MSAHLAHDRAPLGASERSQISYGPGKLRKFSSEYFNYDNVRLVLITERALVGAGLGAAGNLMGAVAKHIGADAPASQRGIQAATPPLASQVPPQAESLFMLLKVSCLV